MSTSPLSSLVEEVAYQIAARRKLHLKPEQEAGGRSVETYAAWRRDDLRSSFHQNFFSAAEVAGKRVLDFGCGFGHLARLAAELGARQVIGVDVGARSNEKALSEPNLRVTFQLELNPSRISLPDESMDVVLTFWMLEHVMTIESIVPEWARILVPGGKVLILWSVWRHPYGHHLHTIVPLPWIHMLLGPAALSRIAARVYDRPDYEARWWHFDSSCDRKANPYRGRTEFLILTC